MQVLNEKNLLPVSDVIAQANYGYFCDTTIRFK